MAKQSDGKQKIPLIGLLAVKNLLITKEDLQKGLKQCSNSDNLNVALKEYFLSRELISSKNMARLERAAKAFENRQKELQFGAIAVKKGFVNKSVLKLALEEQKQDIKNKHKVRRIGDMMVEAGMLTEKQRDYILKLQKRFRQSNKSKYVQEKANGSEAVRSPEEPENKRKGIKEVASVKKISTTDDEIEKDEPLLMDPEIIAGGIKLEIAKDYMSAYITKTSQFDSAITTVEIKEALFEKGIVMGVVEDKMINGFINSSGFKTKSFLIANGITPIDGKDARVEFFFNTDYLKAGGMTEDGSIDFKDRGKVPHVEEGTVLAEKIPMVESRKGHSIFGDEIDTMPGQDITLKYGKGTTLSEDGFKVLAAVKGFPKYTLAGQIFVHQEYVTEGDVDYETGHINYDGNVNIKGRIKSGFKVKGNDITAVELDGGKIDAEGNVKITGGINEGKIYSRGNVYAKFIHKSEIVCMGDVVVEKEIVDSDIESSGACLAENGKLISSRITSKMGIKAKSIGTEMADPNIITVGHDIFVEKELTSNQEQLEKIKKQMEIHEKKKEEYKQENLTLQKQITDLAHVQDRSQLEEREIKSKIESIEQTGQNPEAIVDLKEKMEKLKANAHKAELSLESCFDKSEEVEELVEKEDEQLDALDQQKDHLIEEKNNLIEWAKDNPGKAEVIAQGAVMQETLIRGKHCEKRIKEDTRHVRFYEALCSTDDGANLNIYEIQIGNI